MGLVYALTALPSLILGLASASLGTKVKTRTRVMGEQSGGQIQGFPERLPPGSGLGVRRGAKVKAAVRWGGGGVGGPGLR